MKHNSQMNQHQKEQRGFKNICVIILKKSLFLFIPLLIISIVMFLLPHNHRQTIGSAILTTIVLASISKYILSWIAKDKQIAVLPLILALIGITIPSIAAISNPELYNMTILSQNTEKGINTNIKYDDDLADEIDNKVAIETVVNDIDDGVFKQFYEISYIKNGAIKSNPDATENTKIQLIMDAVINDIEQYDYDKMDDYTNAELNSGKYGELTSTANREERDYRKIEDTLDKQEKIESINNYLQKRLDAYETIRTSELARLIGHTYAELSQHQTVNDNIYSNCSAVSYYFNYCCLSQPESKSKMYYEMGVRFNRIAEITQSIYQQEGSEEYKNLYIDSLYMSVAYYKLYRQSFVEDYKNNFYLARNYKLLSGNMESDYYKSAYLEEALSILFALMERVDNVKTESKMSLFRTLYNTLVEYEAIPVKYWRKYNKSFVIEQKELIGRLIH